MDNRAVRHLFVFGLLTLTGAMFVPACTYAGGDDSRDITEGEAVDESSEAVVAAGKKGLTWSKFSHDATRGQDRVGCGITCNPYVGDTDCTAVRPILCINQDGSSSNGYVPAVSDYWAAGNIALTPPIAGTSLTSLAAANQYCVDAFGPGWRIAEHHDGGGNGWGWRAYGNIKSNTPFWLHINDQVGNCWNTFCGDGVCNGSETSASCPGDCPPACCKTCVVGKACGDTCINVNFQCNQPPGCACNAVEP